MSKQRLLTDREIKSLWASLAGHARAAKLSKRRRVQIARKAGLASAKKRKERLLRS